MTINIIVALTADRAIGRGGDMLFHISDDLRRFRRITTGHPVIMGRKTFESLPKGALPDRRNMVVTRNPRFTAPGIETFSSLTDAIASCRESLPQGEAFILGGGEIYRQAMPLAQRLYLTEINAMAVDADTFFPEIDPADWAATDRGDWQTDQRSGARFRFITMERR